MRMRMMTMMMMVMMMVMMMMGRKRRRRTMTMTVTMTVTMSLHHMHLASFLYRFVCAASHDDLQRYVFNHPIDFHFIADSVANWPKLHLQILKLDACGRIEPLDCKVWNPHNPWLLFCGTSN